MSSSETKYRERRSSGVERSTHPTGDEKIVDADQILLQLQKLLKVLHLDQAALELLHHLGHLGQSSCRGDKNKAEREIFSETQRLNHKEVSKPTSAVPEVHVRGLVVFAQPLQDLLVVEEAVQGPQDEDVQRDVADLLQLKVPAQTLQPAGRPARLLQLQQHLRLLVQARRQGLWAERGEHG